VDKTGPGYNLMSSCCAYGKILSDKFIINILGKLVLCRMVYPSGKYVAATNEIQFLQKMCSHQVI
jgi:hypothetical protein